MQTQYFEHLKSMCGSVELVNAELTPKRILCGFAFIDAYAQQSVSFVSDRGEILAAIAIPIELQNHPGSIAISSPEDDLFFAVLKNA